MRGFYKMEYTGNQGQGAGALAFVDNKVAGLDVGGGVYKGEFHTMQDGTVSGYVDLSFPQGGSLVTGATMAPGGPPMRIPFAIQEQKAENSILRIDTPTGPINLRLTLISQL